MNDLETRRIRGQFYTPKMFVDKAHRMIEAALGEDWKEKFVVWDNCCGTKNLTRDYSFEDLYCSTLEQGELDQCSDYNKNATSFQFDFLNDSLDKLPASLIEALKANKPIVFLLNPPYATACNMGTTEGDHKAGINNTMVRDLMTTDGLRSGAENLQHQFMYRIMQIKRQFNLTDVHIALFSKPIYLTGGKQEKFLNAFCSEFSFVNGILFNAGGFSGVSEKWGITFNIWESGVNTDNNNFIHTLVEEKDGEIVVCGEKNLYNLNGQQTASDWSKEPIKKIKAVDAPQISSGVKVKQSGRGTLVENALGYIGNNSNNVGMSEMYSAIYSSCSSRANGYSITADNFDRCTALFAARKLIVGNWINDKDEYLAPNEAHPGYNEFVNDSLIYSLFHSSSNQSSLRNVEYKGNAWNIKNEFFWRSAAEMAEKANACGNDEMYNDARVSKDRYVYSKLQGIELSAEAKAVLDKANEILDATMSRRKVYNEEHPEYQVNNFDAGFYQLKAICKEYCPELLKEFNEVFKKLSEKMKPMVYELGFLK